MQWLPSCKCTMVALLENASNREFHVQVYYGGVLVNASRREFHMEIFDGGVLGKCIKPWIPCATLRWRCSWKTHQVVSSMCKSKMAVSLESALSRGLHVQMHDGGVLEKRIKPWVPCANLRLRCSWKIHQAVSSMCNSTMAVFLENASSCKFHVQIHDGGVIGNRVKSGVECANARWWCSWKTHQAVSSMCKSTIAVFLENAVSREFHMQI